MPYSLDDLHKARDPKPAEDDLLARIPASAPHDTDDAVGCWNGERFVSWQEWLLSRHRESFIGPKNAAPVHRDTKASNKKKIQECGNSTKNLLTFMYECTNVDIADANRNNGFEKPE